MIQAAVSFITRHNAQGEENGITKRVVIGGDSSGWNPKRLADLMLTQPG